MDKRLIAVRQEILRHPEWAGLAPFIFFGKVEVVEEEGFTTAATDGVDIKFAKVFFDVLTKGQLKYAYLHETIHKVLLHCSYDVSALLREFTENQVSCAMDYVVNLIIEDTEPGIERPVNPPPLINEAYRGMTFVQVLRAFKLDGRGNSKPLDKHIQGVLTGTEGVEKQQEALKQLDKIIAQSKAMEIPLKLSQSVSRVKWQEVMKQLLLERVKGDVTSTYHPLNRRFAPQDFLLPSRKSAGARHLLIACDTSGSMGEYYEMMFAEIAKVLKSIPFVRVTVLWWDDEWHAPVEIRPQDLPKLASMLKPEGTGATDPNTVIDFVKQTKARPDCILYLTDGGFTSTFEKHRVPSIFGIVGDDEFKAPQGRTVHIN